MRFFEFKNPFSSDAKLEVPTGHRGPAIADGQQVLMALGYQLPQHGVDGIDGPETSGAITKFQQDHQLKTSGDFDAATVAALNDLIAEKGIKFNKSTEADFKSTGGAGGPVDVTDIQDPDFNSKLDKISTKLGVSKDALIAIMRHESRMNPKAVNKMSGATGLIQFMPDTARGLGTSVEALRDMSAVEQLDYVYMYYKNLGVKAGSDVGDLYMLTFLPAYKNAPDDAVLGQSGGGNLPGTNLSMDAVYRQNKVFDHNGDGKFTVADVKNRINQFA